MINGNIKSSFLIRTPPHDLNTPILQVVDLSVQYESGYGLKDVSFALNPGERLAVVGPNGAGKSTLFKVVSGVLKPTDGYVKIYGYDPGGHFCIAYVPQRNQVDWNFPVTVADVVMMGRIRKLGLFRWPTSKDWEVVDEALEVVRMTNLKNRQISELSGGQQQRMFIARALAQEAELMLLDEPLMGLDIKSQDDILIILEELHRQGVTIVVALHDLKLAGECFELVMLLNRELVAYGNPDQVFEPEKLLKAYGDNLRIVTTPDGVVILDDSCCDEGEESLG
jgi:manganese/iron transport system ATP-binding protein